MPAIQITDRLGISVNAQLAPASTFLKYAQELPALIMSGADFSRLQGLTLADPAVRSLQPTLTFKQPVSLGKDAPELTLRADAGVSFVVLSGPELFSPDDYGDNIAVPPGRCYVALGFQGSAGAGLQVRSFGIDAGGGVAVSLYSSFDAGAEAPTLAEALRQSVGNFVLPADADDLNALLPGCIATISGRGTLRFSGAANLLVVANPLATLALPAPAPNPGVRQGAAVTVGASWEIASEYQVRAQKLDSRRVRLGWYRKHESEAVVTASADAGISAGLRDTDLFPTLIGAISSDAHADLAELRNAGLPDAEAGLIASAVKAAVNRKLQVGMAAEFGALASNEAAFLYEIDLAALEADGAAAIKAALRGDVSGLADADRLPAGVTALRNILTRANASRFSLKINLLGIFNFASVSRLTLSGTVTYAPSTGELVIADEATAARIQTATINFGADEDKLRGVMAESFLITAAYRGSRSVVAPPELASSHQYFRLDARTSREELRRYAAIAPALRMAPADLPEVPGDFGRVSVFAEARYDDTLARALFLRENGTPRPHGDYENAGRGAIAALVLPDGDDAFRRAPATDDTLWEKMKDLGPAAFRRLFPPLQADVIGADYVAIQWWADSMCGAGAVLARMDRSSPNDPSFQNLRQSLARHLRDVAAKAHPQFGAPWGLVAMFLVSGRSETALQITGSRFVYSARRALGAAG